MANLVRIAYSGYSCNYLQAHPVHFGPALNIKGTLMLRVVHNKKTRNDLSEKHEFYKRDQLFFVAMLLNQQERPPGKYCYHSSESYCL